MVLIENFNLPGDAPLRRFDEINEIYHFRQMIDFRLCSFNGFIERYPNAKKNPVDFLQSVDGGFRKTMTLEPDPIETIQLCPLAGCDDIRWDVLWDSRFSTDIGIFSDSYKLVNRHQPSHGDIIPDDNVTGQSRIVGQYYLATRLAVMSHMAVGHE